MIQQCLPGTHLKQMLESWGLRESAGCPCKSRAKLMDKWGCDECERRIDQIVGWLQEEAAKRRLPFSRTLASVLVRKAIRKARSASSEQQRSPLQN